MSAAWRGRLSRLGVVPQQIPPGDIYPALEKGTIDAAEWIGPYDDEKLGFLKVAPYYYFPGWSEGWRNGFLYINTTKWDELPKIYQDMVTIAAGKVAADLTAKYDARNAQAIKRLVAAGAQLRPSRRKFLTRRSRRQTSCLPKCRRRMENSESCIMIR